MRWGKLTREDPTEIEPVWIECPSCAKRGCGECEGKGRFKISGPIKVPSWCWSVLTVSERYRKGVPPVAGGSLDQTNWINQVCDFVDGERQAHLSEYGAMAMLYG
jgi:hypothetical protein